ncbi:MAG TPA: DUF885 domain-containing protein [Kofleriaceae bacterium]|nr:DUF885 domain-containing protein [Kofleriaceae bacterium]
MIKPSKLRTALFVAAAACGGGPKPVPPVPPVPASAPAPVVDAAPAQTSDVDARKQALDALLEEHWQYALKRNPEMASAQGDRRYNDQWTDRSLAAIAADLETERGYLARLEAIKTDGLPEQSVLDHQILARQLHQRLDNARFEDWLMPVNQFAGVHLRLAELVSQLPFQTVKDYDDYLARLASLPAVLEQTTEAMKLGASKQLMPPRFLLEKCVTQALAIADARPDASPFAMPIKKLDQLGAKLARADRDRIVAAIHAAIQDKVAPAYREFAAFMKRDYVPRGRKDPGMWALPDGDARYAAKVKDTTTTAMTPDEIHELGLREVTRIEGEQAAIARQLGFSSLEAFRKSVRGNRKLYARSREDILARYQTYVDQMYEKLPQLFGHLPKGKMIIKPTESFREAQAAGADYSGGTPDGTRPGAVSVNTYKPTERLTIDMESTAYHEGVPGHHLQVTIQQELTDVPAFRRHTRYVAFGEGWALYAERLGKEVGFYQDPYNDYGHLQDEMLRAIRLVVDTGIHAKHWSRDQVVKFFHDHSSIDEPSVQSETDRYIGNPGQALGYKIGQLTILRLREHARDALGAAFDLRAFHDEVLGAGALPLDLLEQRIDAWIAGRKAAASNP